MMSNIHQLKIPLKGNPLKELNSYLITGSRNLLIDTGFRTEGCRSALLDQLEALHTDLDKTDIFLTHMHSDHSGLAVELHREGCKVFVSSADHERMLGYGSGAAWSRSDEKFKSHGFPQELLLQLRSKNPARSSAPPPDDVYTDIQEGQILEYGGHCLETVATPGHTPGHMCLFDKANGILFLGDHILFDITPNITSWIGVENSLGDYLNSLDKICTLDVKVALPGHRDSGDMYHRAQELKLHHKTRLNEALNILHNNPGSTCYEIASKMTWQIRCNSWEDFPVGQKWFAVGEALSHLDWLEANDLAQKEFTEGIYKYFAI